MVYVLISLLPEILVAVVGYILVRLWSNRRSLTPINWPIVGMLPSLIRNGYRIHEFATEVLRESSGTFELKGPLLLNRDMLVTSDPANIHHILTKNFQNYPKGTEFRRIFDILGDGIFNSDGQLWDFHRKTTLSLLNHGRFQSLLEKLVWRKVKNGLLPILDLASQQEEEVDLQELFQRLTFDVISKLLLDCDPESISPDFPYVSCERALKDAEEALLWRHILPERCWKLQKWLGMGQEKKLAIAWKDLDQFIYPFVISSEQNALNTRHGEEDFDFLASYTREYDGQKRISAPGSPADFHKFMRDAMLNLMIAGKDTTSTTLTWFFWLLARNPCVGTKIRREIEAKLQGQDSKACLSFTIDELRELVYLHGALCEALRLFPPVALQHKEPIQQDLLPSGHRVYPNTKIIMSFYSMGRMEAIWGKDCMEFRPERWISERGSVKYEPSFKFPAFNAGPRACLGKEMAFIQMKIVAIGVIQNYNIQVVEVEGHPVCPSDSIILQMKYGLRAKLTKRSR